MICIEALSIPRSFRPPKKTYSVHFLVLLTLLIVGVRNAKAEVRLARIFADHMVLQRDQPIQIWGWADKGEKVKVQFASHAAETTAAEDGAWSVTLKPLKASAEGKPLNVESAAKSIVVQDVVVGEVWHASGQSNMAMSVGAMVEELESVKADVTAAALPSLRFCRINEAESAQPLDDLRKDASWTVCTPATVSGFSGVAFYFAWMLHKELDVPIGVIDSSRGGTPIEPFIPRAAFDSHPTLRRGRGPACQPWLLRRAAKRQ